MERHALAVETLAGLTHSSLKLDEPEKAIQDAKDAVSAVHASKNFEVSASSDAINARREPQLRMLRPPEIVNY